MRRFAIAALVLIAIASVGVFAAGSYATEGALKPPRLPNGKIIILLHGIGSTRQDMVSIDSNQFYGFGASLGASVLLGSPARYRMG